VGNGEQGNRPPVAHDSKGSVMSDTLPAGTEVIEPPPTVPTDFPQAPPPAKKKEKAK